MGALQGQTYNVPRSALTLFPAKGVALVFGRESPRLRRRSEEHLGDLDPVAAVATR